MAESQGKRRAGGPEVEGFVHDALDRLVQIRRNGAVSEILEYAPTGEPVFRRLGTQGTWYVGAVGTVKVTVAAHVQVAGTGRSQRPGRGPSIASPDVRTGRSVRTRNFP